MNDLTFTVTMRNVPEDLEAGDLATEMAEALETCVQDWPEIEVAPLELVLPGELMRVRDHRGFSHGLKPGDDKDICCVSCIREGKSRDRPANPAP